MKLKFSDRMFTQDGGRERNKKLFDNLDTGASYTNIWWGMTRNYLVFQIKQRSAIFIAVSVECSVRRIDWLINFLENHSNLGDSYIITFNSEPIFTTLFNQPK